MRCVADEHDALPAPVGNDALLEADQARLHAGIICVLDGQLWGEGEIPPAADEGFFVGGGEVEAGGGWLGKALVHPDDGGFFAGEELDCAVDAVGFVGVAREEVRLGGEADPEGAVGCQEGVVIVDLGGGGGGILEGEGAHLGAHEAVGAVGADDEGSGVGGTVGAVDCRGGGGGADGADFFVGVHLAVCGRGEGVIEDLGEGVAADDPRGNAVAGRELVEVWEGKRGVTYFSL